MARTVRALMQHAEYQREFEKDAAQLICRIVMLFVLTYASSVFADMATDSPPIRSMCDSANGATVITLRDAVVVALAEQPQLTLAREEVEKARANLIAAKTPFLPSLQGTFENENFKPRNGSAPVTVVGNNIVGGTQTYSAYGSLALNWNLFNSGKDVAGYHGAKAGIRASEATLNSQINDTLSGILTAYGDLYKAQVVAREQQHVLSLLKTIEARSEERFRNGTGTTIAIGQARTAALNAEQSLYQACRAIADKSSALAQSIGMRLPPDQFFRVNEALPESIAIAGDPAERERILQADPTVVSAKEKMAEAEAKIKQARATYGPTLALVGRKDYLGQDPSSIASANHVGPNSYRIGLMLEQPILPSTSEYAGVAFAKAELREAEARYTQALIDTETKLRNALSARIEIDASSAAAQRSLRASREILTLTDSLYKAGRTDLDNLEHARIDVEKADGEVQQLIFEERFAGWLTVRALHPAEFARWLQRALEIERESGSR